MQRLGLPVKLITPGLTFPVGVEASVVAEGAVVVGCSAVESAATNDAAVKQKATIALLKFSLPEGIVVRIGRSKRNSSIVDDQFLDLLEPQTLQFICGPQEPTTRSHHGPHEYWRLMA